MSYIAVENLKQGMVVEQDVRDITDRLLLSKGIEINEKHLRVLKIWGVSEVNVVTAADMLATEEDATDVLRASQIKHALDFLFQRLDRSRSIVHDVYGLSFMHRYRSAGDAQSLALDKLEAISAVEDSNAIKDKIQRVNLKLPEAPEIVSELNDVIADPLSTSNDIAEVVQKSPSLAALLLKLVNSAFYGFPTKIDRISRAVTIVGSKEISGLAMGLCVMKTFADIAPDVIEMPDFIKHSLGCGLIARIMGARLNIKQTEQLFVAGLLHDIGKLIIFKYFPGSAASCFAAAGAASEPVYQSEKKVLGLHHTQVGKLLLRKWQLPADLEDVIVHHHAPASAADAGKAAIVQTADLIVNALGVGCSGEWIIPHFDVDCWLKLKLAPSSLSTIVRQALHQLQSMEVAFNQS